MYNGICVIAPGGASSDFFCSFISSCLRDDNYKLQLDYVYSLKDKIWYAKTFELKKLIIEQTCPNKIPIFRPPIKKDILKHMRKNCWLEDTQINEDLIKNTFTGDSASIIPLHYASPYFGEDIS